MGLFSKKPKNEIERRELIGIVYHTDEEDRLADCLERIKILGKETIHTVTDNDPNFVYKHFIDVKTGKVIVGNTFTLAQIATRICMTDAAISTPMGKYIATYQDDKYEFDYGHRTPAGYDPRISIVENLDQINFAPAHQLS
jgi:hypothetical protein